MSTSARVSVARSGVTTIAFPEDDGLNTRGEITVEGDVFGVGAVCILGFKVTSDRGASGDAEVDYGTFRLTMPEGSIVGEIASGVILREVETRALARALLESIGVEWPWTT